jgi:hypothetical protein
MDDNEASAEDRRDAGQRVIATFLAEADALVEVRREAAAARGETLSNEQAVDAWNASIAASAATIDSRLIPQLVDMVMAVNDIPELHRTEVTAAIETGDVAVIEETLNRLSRTRKAAVAADADINARNAAEAALNWLARDREAKIYANPVGFGLNSRASGDQLTTGGRYRVGEQGEEEIELPRGARIYNAAQTRQRAQDRANAGPAVVNNITNLYPAGMVPRGVRNAERAYERRQGPI